MHQEQGSCVSVHLESLQQASVYGFMQRTIHKCRKNQGMNLNSAAYNGSRRQHESCLGEEVRRNLRNTHASGANKERMEIKLWVKSIKIEDDMDCDINYTNNQFDKSL